MAKTTDKEQQAVTKAENGRQDKPAIAGSAVLIDEDGKTTIYPQVVAKIAGLAVREVEGVNRLVPFDVGQQVASLAKAITRAEIRDLGVRVEVGLKEAAVDVRIVTDYGASIPAISEAIRRNVSERIGMMTGLQVVEVNIDVMDLYFPEAELEEEEPQLVARRVE